MRKCKICGSYTYVNASTQERICILKKCGWKMMLDEKTAEEEE